MIANPWYRDWFASPFYHQLHIGQVEREASLFIKRLTKELAIPPGNRVLDSACGRGFTSRMMAESGLQVSGVDASADNVDFAKRSETELLEFFLHDIRLPFWGNYFHFAFNLLTNFGHFNTRREHNDALRTISRSLRKDGILSIDYPNTHFLEDHPPVAEVKKIGSTTYTIHPWDTETHFLKKIKIEDPTLRTPLEFTEQHAKFSLGDFTDMLSFQGMQVQRVVGDYNFSDYDTRTSERMIIFARRIQ